MIDYTQEERKEDTRPLVEVKVDPTKTIKQSNRLIEANYYLTETEQKFILFAISQLAKDGENLKRMSFQVKDIAEALGMGGNCYTKLNELCKQLIGRVLVIRDGKNDKSWYMTHWVQSIGYNADEAIITIGFDERLAPDLLRLREAYVTSSSKLCLSFKGKYTARLYLLIKQYERIGERSFAISDIIERFQLSKAYKSRISKIKDILNPALEQLQLRSDINFEYEYIKKGRIVAAIHIFNIKPKYKPDIKNSPKTKSSNAEKTIKEADTLVHQHDKVFEALLKFGIVKVIALSIYNTFDHLQIIRNINYTNKQRNLKNKAGFLMAAIEYDYASVEEEKERIKEREKQLQEQKIKERNEEILALQKIAEEAAKRAKDGKTKEIMTLSAFEIGYIQKKIRRGETIGLVWKRRMRENNITEEELMKLDPNKALDEQ